MGSRDAACIPECQIGLVTCTYLVSISVMVSVTVEPSSASFLIVLLPFGSFCLYLLGMYTAHAHGIGAHVTRALYISLTCMCVLFVAVCVLACVQIPRVFNLLF
jgi:hypothetical protein